MTLPVPATGSSTSRPGFSSHKCPALPYPRRACRDFLVFATLEPSTLAIDPVEPDPSSVPTDCYFSVRLTRSHSQVVVMLCEYTDGPFWLKNHERALAIPRSALNSAAIQTSRIVWSRRHIQVDPAFSLILQGHLAQSGPLGLKQVLNLIDAAPSQVADWTMALACQGLIDLHIVGHLTPATLITSPSPNEKRLGSIKLD